MAGTPEGGRRARDTNRQKYGSDFYKVIGHAGGSISRGGGFARDPELARRAGQKGGKVSRRGKARD